VPPGVPSHGIVDHDRPLPVDSLNAAFLLSKAEGALGEMCHKVKNMTKWAIRDRKQFKVLISDAKDLINSPQEITKTTMSRRQQDRATMSRIQVISDPETLSLISEACEEGHPNFSDAAFLQGINAISMAPTRSNDIADWNGSIEDDASSASGLVRAMEDWTIAEYRQHLLDLVDLRQRAFKPTASFPRCECGAECPTAKDLIQHAREEAACPHCPEKFECYGQVLLHCEGTELICRH
jgi:hypothetical protein